MGKLCSQLFSLQLWVNSRTDCFFNVGMTTSLGKGKLWIQTCLTPLKTLTLCHIILRRDLGDYILYCIMAASHHYWNWYSAEWPTITGTLKMGLRNGHTLSQSVRATRKALNFKTSETATPPPANGMGHGIWSFFRRLKNTISPHSVFETAPGVCGNTIDKECVIFSVTTYLDFSFSLKRTFRHLFKSSSRPNNATNAIPVLSLTFYKFYIALVI